MSGSVAEAGLEPTEEGSGAMDHARRRATTERVFRAQLRLVFRRGWALAALTLATGLPVGIAAAYSAGGGTEMTLSRALGRVWLLPVLLATLWAPIAVWRDEGPSQRAYHWTLPARRSVHQLLRTAAGWLHLAAGLAAGLALGWLWGAVALGGLGPGRLSVLAGLFASASVAYLLGSAAAVATDRPALWLFVAYLAVSALPALAALMGWGWLERAAGEVFLGGTLSLAAALNGPGGAGETLGELVRWRPWPAVSLWLAATAALTAAAARLHLERAGKG